MAFKMKYGKGMTFNYGNKNEPALEFNSGLRAASEAGKLDDNPEFKNKVDNSSFKKTYAEAYASRDKSVYGDLTQAEYTAEAKKQNKSFKQTGKWNAPKTKMTGSKKPNALGPTVTTKRTFGGKKKVRTDPDNYQSTTKTRKDGTKKKRKTDMDITDPNSAEFKTKYNKDGTIRKEKDIYKSRTGEIDVDKTKYNKDGTIRKQIMRTRKKFGTGLGQALKDANEKRNARRKARKKK